MEMILEENQKIENTNEKQPKSEFAKMKDVLIATNEQSYNQGYFKTDRFQWKSSYTLEQAEDIVSSSDPAAKKILSRYAYSRDGIYKQLIMHYSTLLGFNYLLIPNPGFGVSLQQKSFEKRYFAVCQFVDKLSLKETGQRMAQKVLVDGAYYGAILTVNKKDFVMLDLPFDFSRSRFKDSKGSPIVEFNVRYFDTILQERDREAALKAYPPVIAKHYRKWRRKNSIGEWILLPTDVGVCFNLFDNEPYFINTIPALMRYGYTVENEQIKEIEHIKKILVNEMPHLNDGSLVFEPEEALEMHQGTVGMLKRSNPYVSVLTTYGKVSSIETKTTDSVTNNTLENMRKHTYATAGVSPDLFAASGSSALPSSIREDIGVMMVLGTKIQNYITNVINMVFGNASLSFKLMILPVSVHNQAEIVDEYFKLASSGYSHLLPAIASGLSTLDLINLKDLENNMLKLSKKLVPLSSAYTQSADSEKEETQEEEEEEKNDATKGVPVKVKDPNADEGGRPEKKDGERADQTEENRESQAKN